ncbi:MAG TPA: peptidylprolyl isomerase [Burkholderiaceae bacterium]|nr:peptidylprolyl isomerase [Burkholderiaceae bacterium]
MASNPTALVESTDLRVGDRTWTAPQVCAELQIDASDPQRLAAARRFLASRELLLLRAAELCIPTADPESAIDALLEREIPAPEPTRAEMQRFFESRSAAFAAPRRFLVEHILFALVPGAPLEPLRRRAEAALLDLRESPGHFGECARMLSNCPSGADGGVVGWLGRSDCAPEFFAALEAARTVGMLPTLVRSRFGFHIVRVLQTCGGEVPAFDEVRDSVRLAMRRRMQAHALRQYVATLAGRYGVDGCDLAAADSPLVQ